MTASDGNSILADVPPLTVDVWQWSLEAHAPAVLEIKRLLSQDELDRSDRLISERLRADFVVGRAGLRHVLAGYGQHDPDKISFAYGPYGKPSSPDVAVSFSMSHSGRLAVAAVTPERRDIDLGIDIERSRSVDAGLAQRFFSNAENADLAKLEGDAWLEAFFRCWTRKEAIVKALGAGFSIDLSRFDVTIRADQPPGVASFDGDISAGGDWTLVEYIPESGYAGAIAARVGGRMISILNKGDPFRRG